MDVLLRVRLAGVATPMQLPGIRGKGRTIMGDPENEAQQPTPDPEQPDDGGQQEPTPPDDGTAEPDSTKTDDEGGIGPENTWHG
jgi:hypothetical protein